jgi:hypothetical protein
VKRKDVPPLVNALDYETRTKVVNIGLTRGGDSVQMYMDLRDEEDDPGYALIMTDDGARALGRWLIEYAEGRTYQDLSNDRRSQWP